MKKVFLAIVFALSTINIAKADTFIDAISDAIGAGLAQGDVSQGLTDSQLQLFNDEFGVGLIGPAGSYSVNQVSLGAIYSITPPSFSAGCSGISWTFGAIDIISGEELLQFIEGVAAALPGYALQLAIATLCPKCEETITYWLNKANQLALKDWDSCRTAQALTHETIGTLDDVFEEDCSTFYAQRDGTSNKKAQERCGLERTSSDPNTWRNRLLAEMESNGYNEHKRHENAGAYSNNALLEYYMQAGLIKSNEGRPVAPTNENERFAWGNFELAMSMHGTKIQGAEVHPSIREDQMEGLLAYITCGSNFVDSPTSSTVSVSSASRTAVLTDLSGQLRKRLCPIEDRSAARQLAIYSCKNTSGEYCLDSNNRTAKAGIFDGIRNGSYFEESFDEISQNGGMVGLVATVLENAVEASLEGGANSVAQVPNIKFLLDNSPFPLYKGINALSRTHNSAKQILYSSAPIIAQSMAVAYLRGRITLPFGAIPFVSASEDSASSATALAAAASAKLSQAEAERLQQRTSAFQIKIQDQIEREFNYVSNVESFVQLLNLLDRNVNEARAVQDKISQSNRQIPVSAPPEVTNYLDTLLEDDEQ